MRAALKLFAPLLLVLVVSDGEAHACSCMGDIPPCQAYWQASAVFVGQVVGVSTVETEEGAGEGRFMYPRRLVRFAVERGFRGTRGGAYVEVLTGQGGGDCGYQFERGGRYLVYAHHDEKRQRLSTGICTRTRPVSEAGEDLQYINSLSQGPPTGGTIYGQVSKNRREPGADGNDRHERAPLPGAKVEAAGGGKTFRAETDAQGDYRLPGLPPGEYTLRLDLPETLLAYAPVRSVRVAERGCAVEWFGVESNGRLTGRVLDAEGRPAAKAVLRLSEAARGEEYFRGHTDHATSDSEGRYEFKGVPPGRYVIKLRFDGDETDMRRPFPVFYHADAPDAARASVVEIGEGAKVEGYDIRLPPLPAERTVEGVVAWADGRPAPGVNVDYTADIPHSPVGYGVKADDAGRFSFKVYEGVGLRLGAAERRADGSRVSSEVVNVPASGAVGPVRLVLPRP